MKKIGLIFIVIFSCNSGNKQNIKNNILYKDQKGNIYLKREIDIMDEKNSQNNQSRFFDLVFYKDSTYQLKNIVDIKTFHFVKSVTDTAPLSKFDVFEDKMHTYKFQYLPPASPQIKAMDK